MLSVVMTGESVRYVNAATLASHAKHALEDRIKIVPNDMCAIHEGQFDGCVAAQQMRYDTGLSGKLIEGGQERWNHDSSHL